MTPGRWSAILVLFAACAFAAACADASESLESVNTPTQSRAIAVEAATTTPIPTPPCDPVPTPKPASGPGAFADLAELYQSLDELVLGSDLIVVVTVQDTESIVYERLPFTIATLNVENSLLGDETAATIRVVETGGPLQGQSKEEPGTLSDPVDLTVNGVPVMQPGERWLLFLGRYDFEPVAGDAYSVLGVFQGKFLIGADTCIDFTGPPQSLDSIEFTMPAAFNGLPLSDIVGQIEHAKARLHRQ